MFVLEEIIKIVLSNWSYNYTSLSLSDPVSIIYLIYSLSWFYFIIYEHIELIGFRISCDTVAFIIDYNYFSPYEISNSIYEEMSDISKMEYYFIFVFGLFIIYFLTYTYYGF